jgi:hypothetical protein
MAKLPLFRRSQRRKRSATDSELAAPRCIQPHATQSPLSCCASRRDAILRTGASRGALALLSGCEIIDGPTAENALRVVSRFNDRVQSWLFNPNRLAPTYPEGAITRPFPFNAYYRQEEAPDIDEDNYKLLIEGLVDDKRPWTLDRLYARSRPFLRSSLSTEIQHTGSAAADQLYGLACSVHDNVNHARDRIFAVVNTARVSVIADLAHSCYLLGSSRSCSAGGIYCVALLACPTEMRPATRLLLCAGGERYGAAATPRPFETGNSQLLGRLCVRTVC